MIGEKEPLQKLVFQRGGNFNMAEEI